MGYLLLQTKKIQSKTPVHKVKLKEDGSVHKLAENRSNIAPHCTSSVSQGINIWLASLAQIWLLVFAFKKVILQLAIYE